MAEKINGHAVGVEAVLEQKADEYMPLPIQRSAESVRLAWANSGERLRWKYWIERGRPHGCELALVDFLQRIGAEQRVAAQRAAEEKLAGAKK